MKNTQIKGETRNNVSTSENKFTVLKSQLN